jgi:hypothetical protein
MVFSFSSSSSSIGITTLSWVSACSTVIEHSQQEGFTECRCQRHVKPPNLEGDQGFRAFQLSPQESPSIWSDASELSSGRWNYGREMAENFAESDDFHVTFAVKHDMGQTTLLLLRRKACWGFFSLEKSDGFGRVWTHELGYQRPARYL